MNEQPSKSIRIQGFNTRRSRNVNVEIVRIGNDVYLSPHGSLDNALRVGALDLEAALDEIRPEETPTTEGD